MLYLYGQTKTGNQNNKRSSQCCTRTVEIIIYFSNIKIRKLNLPTTVARVVVRV